ncbi:MAG TPA: helix-turn-helix domain-containing protein [Mycobacteriales bacterium]|nr:helix-turn-helix domain-containing protein [Mycobacteriales bacterium]
MVDDERTSPARHDPTLTPLPLLAARQVCRTLGSRRTRTPSRGCATPRPKLQTVTERDDVGTRELILSTALDLFRQQGYSATSLRQISDAIGTTKAALYYHFPAKEQILLEIARPLVDDLSGFVTELRTPHRAGHRTETAVLRRYLGILIEQAHILQILSTDPESQNHPDIGRRVRTLIEAIHNHLSGPDADVQRKVRVACAIGALTNGVASTSPATARKHADLILEASRAALGVKAPKPG